MYSNENGKSEMVLYFEWLMWCGVEEIHLL